LSFDRPARPDTAKPVMAAIQRLFGGLDDLSRLPDLLQSVAEAEILRLPGFAERAASAAKRPAAG
jgi:hypothetical protein